ncbi:MAG TPA: translation elongation factor Ts [Candidatus Moranbacteria bacterium]|nr:translation elongation factor Ts [Candidatus Moranbacteria bacterium]HAT74545.1 translation elongation factor Ts [Candidatus Moranbacteria bacterium]
MPTIEQIKKIRELLGSGIVETKKALDEAGGGEEKAIEILRKNNQSKAVKKSDREAGEGAIVSYIHPNNKLGVIVKLYCESDFVARNADFLELAKDIAMHICAMNPENIDALLAQFFVKNPEQTISELINEKIAKIGENIRVGDFFRVVL